jgi:hypothetical protein
MDRCIWISNRTFFGTNMRSTNLLKVFHTDNLDPNQNDNLRAFLGFLFGLIIMLVVVNVFVVNKFDFGNMRKGVITQLSGINPWAIDTRISHYYNPPFSVIFLWPLMFTSPELILSLGGALLSAVIFYQKTWVGFAWFLTNSFLWIIAAGGIDMYVMGAGLLLLFIGEKYFNSKFGLILRVLAYGFLLVKPQGGIFIVALYILFMRDWKALLLSLAVYGLIFVRYYPDWFRVLLTDPPISQTVEVHSIWGKFGPLIAIPVALWVIISRKWNYWQLGGVLAGILPPYAMPGIPLFITLTSIKKLIAIPIIVVYSGCLAALTWIDPPPGTEFYAFSDPLKAIYHLSLLGLSIILACYSAGDVFDYSRLKSIERILKMRVRLNLLHKE